MKWEEARDKLLEIAAGRYCQLRFGFTMKDGKPFETDCWVYVDKGHSSRINCPTWEKAFEELDKEMNPKPRKLEAEPLGVVDTIVTKNVTG